AGRPAASALDLRGPAEQERPLADPGQPEVLPVSRLRGLRGVEPDAVVDDLRADAGRLGGDPHRHGARAAVLADVRERLLEHAVERDPLRRGESVERALQREARALAAPALEGGDLLRERSLERAIQDDGRLEARGELAQ